MRAAPFATIVGLTLGLLSQTVLARDPLTISGSVNGYDAMKKELDTIQPYLEASQCGGWNGRSVAGTIATVSGLPGRNGVWDGAVLTGMATRKDENGDNTVDQKDFIFPDNAVGLTTACKADTAEIAKTVWRKGGTHADEIVQVQITFPHPKFQDPSCRWRRTDGGGFSNQAPDIPLKDSYDPQPEFAESTQGPPQNPPGDRQSPATCTEFCSYLNTWQYEDCLNPQDKTDDAGVTYKICKDDKWGNKYLCSDQEVKDANGACNSNGGDAANSRQCIGKECRCQNGTGSTLGGGCIANPGTKQEESPSYYSYYRTYQGEYSRDAVTKDAGRDVASDKATVACYGFYKEFDPKDKQTEDKDRRCVINIDVSGRRDSQTGKGEYGQKSNISDRDPNDWRNERDKGSYNQWGDLWYKRFTGGFSLLNERVFSGSYSKDLTNVFLDVDKLDTATMRATEQLGSRASIAPGSYIRAFDDTGERDVASWWQTQQNAVASIMHPPIIRMILPSGWAMGIDAHDPFFGQTGAKILTPNDKHESRIEVQINADDDSLGAALAYLQRSLLLHVVEEPVRAIVPVGSATEFRTKADAWCTWYMRRENKADCTGAPADVRGLIDSLQKYATDIDQYRLLRAELPIYAAKILNVQQSVTKPVTDWMSSNLDEYQRYLEQQRLLQKSLGDKWRTVQESYETFGSATNMPWCMNQRFTLPVYSLLDDWLPSRATKGSLSADGLPVIPVEANADIVIDLSAVAFMSGAITLPVLDPVQVRVTDFPEPPSPNETKPIPAFPDLPSISAIRDALKTSADALPKPSTSFTPIAPIDFEPIDKELVSQQNEAIGKIQTVIDGMKDRYEKFWKAIGPFKPQNDDSPDADFDATNDKSIAYKKPERQCMSWNDSTCQFVEMNLREEFQRIASRPLVFLKEDYASKDEPRAVGGPCVSQDDVCSPLHPEEGGEQHLWEIIGPKNVTSTLGALRTAVRNATLPRPVGTLPTKDFPHYGTSTGNLLPSFNVPAPINLFPARSSAASSTSTSTSSTR